MPRVDFEPAGAGVEVAPGTSLLEAAARAGVHIRNDCGGRGACGRCVVRIQSGTVARLRSRFQLQQGEDLACRALTLESDVSVFVPESSREVTPEVTVEEVEPLAAEFPSPGAPVKRIKLELSAPSLEDNVSDHDRLLRALRRWREADYEVPADVLRSLPSALREAHWKPEVTLVFSPGAADVVEVCGGRCGPPCVLVVDVGTTTLKARLLAPESRWQASCYNSQVMYGPDVISRIIHCQQQEGGLERMQSLVVGDVNRLLEALLEVSGVAREDVCAVVAGGNTTMTHVLVGMCPVWIRREPYVGGSYHLPPIRACEVGLEINPRGLLLCLPSVSSYVGGDITAGVLATGLHRQDALTMLVDLGTNGEIVIGSSEFIMCCSASAGPAFEGGASASGTRAVPGAVEDVWQEDGVRWRTIGDAPPVGICGSGYIDLLAVLAGQGVVDRTGRFQEGSSDSLRSAEAGAGLQYVLVPARETAGGTDVVLSQADVDNLVRAKGAIYAAATVLLESLSLDWSDLEKIMLAGGFGHNINKHNAVQIGLLPDVPREKIEFVGNTSLRGAVMVALSEESHEAVEDVSRRMTYLELSTHPRYMDEFVAACFLPHTDAEKFPSVGREGGAQSATLADRR